MHTTTLITEGVHRPLGAALRYLKHSAKSNETLKRVLHWVYSRIHTSCSWLEVFFVAGNVSGQVVCVRPVEASFCHTQLKQLKYHLQELAMSNSFGQIAVVFYFPCCLPYCLKCRAIIGLKPNLFSFLTAQQKLSGIFPQACTKSNLY